MYLCREPGGGFFISMWVFLVAALVGAYLLSYAGCSSSVIYFLLRRKVDATDLDEVYVEEEDEWLPEYEDVEVEEAPAESTEDEAKED